MTVSVIVPWQPGCQHREAAWDFLRPRWAEVGELVVGTCTGPWVKADAIADGLDRATGDMLVIADADVWVDPTEALDACVTWAIPHRNVHRLSAESTALVLAGAEWRGLSLDRDVYKGFAGGGVTVVRREVYEDCPMPRIEGWGQEDEAWALALTRLHGSPFRGQLDLVHLWHPPQPRLTNDTGSIEGRRLRDRYRRANPRQMRAIVEEAKRVDREVLHHRGDTAASH